MIDSNDVMYLAGGVSDSFLRIQSPVPQTLCVDSSVFHLNCQFIPVGSEIQLEVTANETQVPMGHLRFETEGCRFLRLQNKDMIVLLNNPQGRISVPVGRYAVEDCIPILADRKYWPKFVSSDLSITVSQEDQALLRIGAPLKHYVNVKKTQNLISLGYQMVGAGGELYRFRSIEKRPEFEIFKGPIKIADGKIPFG